MKDTVTNNERNTDGDIIIAEPSLGRLEHSQENFTAEEKTLSVENSGGFDMHKTTDRRTGGQSSVT